MQVASQVDSQISTVMGHHLSLLAACHLKVLGIARPKTVGLDVVELSMFNPTSEYQGYL